MNDWIKRWSPFIVCFVLFLICAPVFIFTATDVRDPTERYDTYIEVQEDGFETVNFFFTNRIEKSMGKPIIMREVGMELLTDYYNPNGLYYRYSVVYRNGTILETEKEFIPFGINRTLMDFDDIELSILQIFTKYGPSSEEMNEEFILLTLTGVSALFSFFGIIAAWFDANDPYKYGCRYG